MRHRTSRLAATISLTLTATTLALGFSQKTITTRMGHEAILKAAAADGGLEAGPAVTRATAACRFCDHYGTDDWRLWSVIMGNRWADIGGYNIVREVAMGKLYRLSKKRLGHPDCFDAVMQDADAVQYQHALRAWGDSGDGGLSRTRTGVRTLLWNHFWRAVHEEERSMWVRVGGALSVSFVKVDRPYFFLGLAAHVLQDSFSTEHTLRDRTWRVVENFKTYVGTTGVARHATPGANPDEFAPPQFLHEPNEKNGDFIFRRFDLHDWTDANVKDAALSASAATRDSMQAFERARASPDAESVATIWSVFEETWLNFYPAADADNPGASVDLEAKRGHEDTIELREKCLEQSGRADAQIDLPDYPPFCWPQGSKGLCTEDYTQVESRVADDAQRALAMVRDQMLPDLFDAASRTPEERDDAVGPSEDLSQRIRDAELDAVGRYFSVLGDSPSMLTEDERRRAIEPRWRVLTQALDQEAARVRDSACGRLVGVTPQQCRQDVDLAAMDVTQRREELFRVQLRVATDPEHSDILRAEPRTMAELQSQLQDQTAVIVALQSQVSPTKQTLTTSRDAGAIASTAAEEEMKLVRYRQRRACSDDVVARLLEPVGHRESCAERYPR